MTCYISDIRYRLAYKKNKFIPFVSVVLCVILCSFKIYVLIVSTGCFFQLPVDVDNSYFFLISALTR